MALVLTDGKVKIGAYRLSKHNLFAICIEKGNAIHVCGYFSSEEHAKMFMDELCGSERKERLKMAEYIERKPLRKTLELWRDACADVGDEYRCGLLEDVLCEVDAQTIADVAPVVRGHWIPISDGAWAKCSECGEDCDVSDNGGMAAFELFCDFYKHCPNCGAKMDGGTK